MKRPALPKNNKNANPSGLAFHVRKLLFMFNSVVPFVLKNPILTRKMGLL